MKLRGRKAVKKAEQCSANIPTAAKCNLLGARAVSDKPEAINAEPPEKRLLELVTEADLIIDKKGDSEGTNQSLDQNSTLSQSDQYHKTPKSLVSIKFYTKPKTSAASEKLMNPTPHAGITKTRGGNVHAGAGHISRNQDYEKHHLLAHLQQNPYQCLRLIPKQRLEAYFERSNFNRDNFVSLNRPFMVRNLAMGVPIRAEAQCQQQPQTETLSSDASDVLKLISEACELRIRQASLVEGSENAPPLSLQGFAHNIQAEQAQLPTKRLQEPSSMGKTGDIRKKRTRKSFNSSDPTILSYPSQIERRRSSSDLQRAGPIIRPILPKPI